MSAARVLTNFRTWLIPLMLILGISALFPAIYLSSTTDPQANLENLPVGLVVEEQSGSAPVLAASVADAIEDGGGGKIAFTRMTEGEMSLAMEEDRIAGAVVLPADFDASIATLLPTGGPVSVPTVTIFANAGDGGLSNGLLSGNVVPLLHGVGQELGARLTAGAAPLPAANAALLAEPFDITSTAFDPLPAHAGLGTSAFYYALILVLIAFIGASLIGPLVDSALGFAPSEVGPVVQRRPFVPTSRLRTYLGKLSILLIASPVAALVLQTMATQVIGIPIGDPWVLWLFSSAVIAAVGASALTVFAIFGPGIGALVNTVFFIALAMASSGGTVPLEATPPFFQWTSSFAPFRPIVDGIRSLFYFDGNPAAGLTDAWVSVGIGGATGLALGLLVTTLYGKVPAFSRSPRPSTVASS